MFGEFPCASSIGDTFVGRFTVDDSVLSSDGTKTDIPVSNFFIKIGRVAWDQNGGDPDNFFGGFWISNGIFTDRFEIVVSSGKLVDLEGSVISLVIYRM